MKKFLALLLAAMMTLSFAACGDQGGTTPSNTGDNPSSDASTPTPTSADTKNEIIRGSVTALDANMMAGWTNSAANNEVRNLIFGYSTIFYTKDGQFVFDPVVVKSHEDVVNEDGTKTYTDTNGLTYTLGADGTTWTEDAGGTALAAAPTAVTMNEFTMFGNTVYKDVAETGGETYRDATGAVLYQKDADGEYTIFTDAAGNTFTKVGDQFMDAAGNPYEKTEDGTYVNIGSGATLDVSAQPRTSAWGLKSPGI